MNTSLFIVLAGITVLYVQLRRFTKARSSAIFTTQIYELADSWTEALPDSEPLRDYWLAAIQVKASRVTDLSDQIDLWWLITQIFMGPVNETTGNNMPSWTAKYDLEIKLIVLKHVFRQSPILCFISTCLYSITAIRKRLINFLKKVAKIFDGPDSPNRITRAPLPIP